MKNLLWAKKYGLGSSWLGWGLKPPPEKQEDLEASVWEVELWEFGDGSDVKWEAASQDDS